MNTRSTQEDAEYMEIDDGSNYDNSVPPKLEKDDDEEVDANTMEICKEEDDNYDPSVELEKEDDEEEEEEEDDDDDDEENHFFDEEEDDEDDDDENDHNYDPSAECEFVKKKKHFFFCFIFACSFGKRCVFAFRAYLFRTGGGGGLLERKCDSTGVFVHQ